MGKGLELMPTTKPELRHWRGGGSCLVWLPPVQEVSMMVEVSMLLNLNLRTF